MIRRGSSFRGVIRRGRRDRRELGREPALAARVLTVAASPQGSLPFDLPASMAAVEANRPDVPFDTSDPLFRFGHGLRYAG